MIDPALLRPGRLDKIIFVSPPQKDARVRLFKYYLKEVAGADKIDYEKLAEESEGFTPADIASVCQEVKMIILRKKVAGQEMQVNTEMVLDILLSRNPSVTVDLLKDYLKFVKEYGERR